MSDIILSYRIFETEDSYERQITVFAHAKHHLVQDDFLRSELRRYIALLRDANIIHEEDSVKSVISRSDEKHHGDDHAQM